MAVAAASARCQQLHELGAALVALLRGGEDLVRLQIQEAQAHGAMAHDAFQVPDAAAAAEFSLGSSETTMWPPSQTPSACGIAPEADAVAQGPDADQLSSWPRVAAMPAATASASFKITHAASMPARFQHACTHVSACARL